MADTAPGATAPTTATGATQDTGATAPINQNAAPVDTAAAEKAKLEAEKRKYKLKVNGAEEEWDEDNVVRFAQKGRAYERKMQEEARQRKQEEKARREYEELFKKNKRLALEKAVGRDALREAAIELLREEIEDQQDPRSKEARQLRRELEELKEQQRRAKEEEEEAKLEAETQEWRKTYDEQFTEALQGLKIRKHPAVIRRMAELQLKNLKNGGKVPLTKIAKMVEKEFTTDFQEYARSLDPDSLGEIFGNDVEEKIAQRRIAKLKNPIPQAKKETSESSSKPKPKGPLSLEEWEAELQKRLES